MDQRETPYRFEEAETHCIIELMPELNKAPWGDIDSIGTSLVERMRAFADGKGKKSAAFLIDLSPLNYMGSAMVALVVRLWKLVKEKNGKMAVVNHDPTVLEVLRLSGLEDVWTIVTSREDGFKSLGLVVKRPAIGDGGAGTGAVGASSGTVVEEPRSAAGWTIAAIVLLVAAAVGLFFFASGSSPVKDTRISLALLFGGGVLGLIPAVAAVCLGMGFQRTAGIAAVVGCLAMLAAGVVVHPDRDGLLARKKTSPPTNNGGVSKPNGKSPDTTKTQAKNDKTDSQPDPKKPTSTVSPPKARSAKSNKPTIGPKSTSTKSDGPAVAPPLKPLGGKTP